MASPSSPEAASASPHWLAGADRSALAAVAGVPRTVDVAVVGGGMIGVACAYWLARVGCDVALLESRQVGYGASGRSGGFMLGTPLQVDKLRELLQAERIDAEFETPGHLALASGAAVAGRFAAEIDSRPTSASHVEMLCRSDCEDLLGMAIAERYAGGRWQPGGATIDPARLVLGLAAAAVRRGAVVIEDCSVRALEPGRRGVRVLTDRGPVRADQVVVACGARSGALLPGGERLLRPLRGQVLATEPLPPRFGPGMAVDYGSVYWRQTSTGAIVLGGCRGADPDREESFDEAVNPVVQEALERFLPRAFPSFGPVRVARRWAGVMDFTDDGRPVLGRWPRTSSVWVAAGFGGHGFPPASGVGRTLAEAIVIGRDSEWLERLAPDRDMEAAAA